MKTINNKFNIYCLILTGLFILTYFKLNASAVVFLQGTSRSGKSSICTEIEQFKDWESVGSVYFSYSFQVFNELFPEIFAHIKDGIEQENIRHAITRNIYTFKNNVDENKKELIIQASQQIQKYFEDPVLYTQHMKEFSAYSLNEISTRVTSGLHVLADVSWYVTEESIKNLKPTPAVFTVLVYCPLNKVLERLLDRNQISLETDNIMNYRYFIEPLMSFSSLYDLSPDEHNSIDIIKKSKLLSCLDMIETLLPSEAEMRVASKFMMQEITREQLREYRKKILNKFGDNEVLYLKPQKKYDLIIKTEGNSPRICAEQIIEYVKKNSP